VSFLLIRGTKPSILTIE
jgi:hypothetical protein